MRNFIFKLLVILFLGLSAFQPGIANAQTKQITVAVIADYPPFSVLMPNGKPAGLLVDMWRVWAETTGTRVQFKFSTIAQNIDDLKTGQVDVIAGLFRNKNRAEWAAFSTPIHEIATSIYFRSDNEKTPTLNELSGKRLGTIEGSYQERLLLDNYPDIEVIGFENDIATVTALLNNELDAIAGEEPVIESTLGLLGLRGILQRGRETLTHNFVHAMVQKGQPDLLRFINDGFKMIPIEQLAELESQWLPKLKTRFYRSGTGRVILTNDETAWIRAHKEITIGVDGNWPPVDFMDNQGNHVGITADFLNIIAERLGITFNVEPGPSFKEMLSKVMDGHLKVGSTIIPNEERAKNVTFTNPFIIIPKIVVTRDDYTDIQKSSDLAGKTIAIEKDNGIIKLLDNKYPNITFKPFSGTLEALKAVSFGKADAYIGSQAVVDWLIRKEQIVNLIYVADSGVKRSPQTFAVFKSPEWNPFVEILNKALDSISDEERKSIYQRWNRSYAIPQKTLKDSVYLTKEEMLWLGENPVWKIANETNWPPFDFTVDGAPRGFSVDVIQLIASKVDASLEFVNGLPWQELVDRFKAGELDILPAVFKTAERLDYMDFTESYASNPSVIVVHSYNTTITHVTDLKEKSVAVIQGYATAQLLEKNYPGIHRRAVKDVSEALKLVSTGEVDAFIGALGTISYIMEKSYFPDIRIVGDSGLKNLKETKLHLAIAKDRKIFSSILQKGLDAITNSEISKIRKRWMPNTSNATDGDELVDLTRGEQRWLAEQGELSLGVDPSWPPFEFFDDNGSYSGLGAGYVDLVSSRLSINLTPKVGLSWLQVIEKAKAGEIDILPTLAMTPERKKYLNFTSPYVSFPMVIATRKDAPFVDSLDGLDGKKVGVVNGYVTQELLESNHKSINVVPFKTLGEVLRALDDGEIDAVVDNLATITYQIEHSKYTDLKIAAPTQYKFELAMAVRKGLPELVPILEKALETISKRDRAAIINSWIGIHLSYGTDFKTILLWAAPIGTIIVLILVIIVRVNRKMSSEISERKEAEQKLADKETLLRAALDNMSSGIFMFDKDQNIVLFNDQYLQIYDIPKDLISIGDSPRKALRYQAERGDFGEGDTEELVERVMGTLTAGEVIKYERKLVTGLIVEINLAPTPDGSTIAVYNEITERKQAEEQISKAHDLITNSINYASTIQRSILPDITLFETLFSDYFIQWKPRDVVGGDIYWASGWGEGTIIVLGDCTGHGVPGAFMSLLTTGAMKQALLEVRQGNCDGFLRYIHRNVQSTLGQNVKSGESDDGMELGVCYFEPNSNEMVFAGARFDLYIVENGVIEIIKPTKSGIGYCGIPPDQEFDEHRISLTQSRSFYMTSDGLVDQVGGERKRMFGKKRFKELLLSIQHKPMSEQKELIYNALIDYQGDEIRRDDVAVIGFKI